MEDLLVNIRVGKLFNWTWHGVFRGKQIVDPDEQACVDVRAEVSALEMNSVWVVAPDGASSAGVQMGSEDSLTQDLIRADSCVLAALAEANRGHG